MKTLFITGATGFIGAYVARYAASSGEWNVVASYREATADLPGVTWVKADITDASGIRAAIEQAAPDAVIHLAAVSKIDLCETEQEFAHRVNVQGTMSVSDAASSAGARLITISSDNVFDGTRACSTEDDPANPVNYYGRTKLMAENEAMKRNTDTVAVRLPLTLGFALTNARPFFNGVVSMLREGKTPWFTTDEFRSPCDAATLGEALVELAEGTYRGVLHLGGTDRVSPADIARPLYRRLGVPEETMRIIKQADITIDRAPRPLDISMSVTKAQSLLNTHLPSLEESFNRIWSHADPKDTDLTQS